MKKISDDSYNELIVKRKYKDENSSVNNKKNKECNIFMDDDNQYVSAMLERQSNIFKKIS